MAHGEVQQRKKKRRMRARTQPPEEASALLKGVVEGHETTPMPRLEALSGQPQVGLRLRMPRGRGLPEQASHVFDGSLKRRGGGRRPVDAANGRWILAGRQLPRAASPTPWLAALARLEVCMAGWTVQPAVPGLNGSGIAQGDQQLADRLSVALVDETAAFSSATRESSCRDVRRGTDAVNDAGRVSTRG